MPDAITCLFKEAHDAFPLLEGKPPNDDLLAIQETLLPLLMVIPYDQLNGVHSLTAILTASEEQNKMVFMGHQILSCHVPVVRSFFILWKMLLLSQNLSYDHLQICANITFQYPKK